MNREPGPAVTFAIFTCGWGILAIVGVALTLSREPLLALAVVSLVGIVCSIKGFGGCEMLVAMIVFTTVGAVLFPATPWAWIAPFLPGGFMVSAVAADLVFP